MRHLKSGRKLSRTKEHRVAMLANMASSIIKHGRVRTTDAKAKEVRSFLEKLVTFSRRGDLHARRIVLSRLKGDQDAVKKLFDELGPRYTNRPGGYTRIVKLGFRQGDNASMSLIEFVEEEMEKKVSSKKSKASAPKAAKKTKEAPEAKADEAVAEAEAVETVDAAAAEVAEEAVTAEAEVTEVAEEAAEKATGDTEDAAEESAKE